MQILTEEVKTQLREILEAMENEVHLALFTKNGDCPTCEETTGMLKDLEDVTAKVVVHYYDLEMNQQEASDWDVKLTPSIVVLDSKKMYHGIKFNGIPAGHEINSFIKTLLEVSGAGAELPPEVQKRLDAVSTPVNIKVFVTLGCPHCPGAVEKAHKLALSNPHISSEMIEAQTFHDVSNEFNVSSVPKIVINNKYEFVGDQPLEVFLEEIEKVHMPS